MQAKTIAGGKSMLGCEKVLHYCFYGFFALALMGCIVTGVALFKAIEQSEDAKILSFAGISISSVSTLMCLGIIFLKKHFYSSQRFFDKKNSNLTKHYSTKRPS